MDGVSIAWGSRVGIVLDSLEVIRVERLLRLGFYASNNEADYEALVDGLRAAVKVGAIDMEIHSNSHLVVSQVEKDFEARDPRMVDYLKLVNLLQAQFESMKVTQIFRGQNSHANSLATSVGSSIPQIISLESLESPSINHQKPC